MSTPLALELPPELVEAIAERAAELVSERAAESNGEPNPWLNTEQAAEHLGCGPDRIRDLKERGLIEHRKDGARLLFRRSWLDAYIEQER